MIHLLSFGVKTTNGKACLGILILIKHFRVCISYHIESFNQSHFTKKLYKENERKKETNFDINYSHGSVGIKLDTIVTC